MVQPQNSTGTRNKLLRNKRPSLIFTKVIQASLQPAIWPSLIFCESYDSTLEPWSTSVNSAVTVPTKLIPGALSAFKD